MSEYAAALIGWFGGVSFAHAVWLAPAAFALHIVEEAPRFPQWARRFANPRFTVADYFRIHLGGLLIGVAAAALMSCTTHPWLAFTYFTLIFLPGYVFNVFFHVGATIRHRRYCPGVITAVAV